jgi:hypothetical protein
MIVDIIMAEEERQWCIDDVIVTVDTVAAGIYTVGL